MNLERREQVLSAGPWSATLSPTGSLTRIYWGDVEILRGLSVVVRTGTWLTVVPEATVTTSTTHSGFSVAIAARNQGHRVDFSWNGEITCDARGELRFAFTGVANDATLTNRIGIVALHPLHWAGHQCEVTHSDGSTEVTSYPKMVSPHQPIKDIRKLSQKLPNNQTLTMSFDGEIFEMEDQRNWTDASFKTYSRPLEWPFPYEIAPNETVSQHITLSLSPSLSSTGMVPATHGGFSRTPDQVAISLDRDLSESRWPQLGLGTDPTQTGLIAPDVVRKLRPTHLRVDVVAENGVLRGSQILEEVARCDVPIELAVHVGDNHETGLETLASMSTDVNFGSVLVFDTAAPSTSARATNAVKRALARTRASDTPVFVGTDDNFAELNRNRCVPFELDAYGISFSPNPQIHASDERSIIETAEAIPSIISTARDFSHGAPVAISPLTFKARRNIHAPGRIIDRVDRDDDSTDPRWGSMFSAVWLISTLVPLISCEVERVTVADIAGPRGIVRDPHRSEDFASDLALLWKWLSVPRESVYIPPTGESGIAAIVDTSSDPVSALIANCSFTEQEILIQGSRQETKISIPALSFRILEKE